MVFPVIYHCKKFVLKEELQMCTMVTYHKATGNKVTAITDYFIDITRHGCEKNGHDRP